MKKFMLMAAVLIASVAASAQNEVGQITVAPTVGLNLSSTTGDGAKMMPVVAAGVVGEYGLMDKLGISAGLMFSMQGAKVDGSDEKLKMNYLNIPILGNYYVWQGLAIKAGIQPGILLSAKAGDYDIKSDCKSLDFSIPVGVSYEINKFVVDARYNIGLTGIVDGGDSAKNSVFQITVGYKFNL